MTEKSPYPLGTLNPDPAAAPQPISLSSARCGQRLRVVGVRSTSSACARLRELGLCERAEVCKVSDGSALVCIVAGVRLAIARQLGAEVIVEPYS